MPIENPLNKDVEISVPNTWFKMNTLNTSHNKKLVTSATYADKRKYAKMHQYSQLETTRSTINVAAAMNISSNDSANLVKRDSIEPNISLSSPTFKYNYTAETNGCSSRDCIHFCKVPIMSIVATITTNAVD